ncbi:MAG: glycosyltransferase family 2 protein [Lachnospiraceae bacterium]|nr:glycosyltransferase family 2 protein [Lachnospiraceae bacterium]
MKTVSIIVPCYNEEEVIQKFYQAILALWQDASLRDLYTPELVFVDDGSGDQTAALIREIASGDERVRYTSFSRNFGKEAAIFCGLRQATGEAVIVMDADLQHPPAAIPEMLKKWEEGYEIVEGVKSSRGKETRSHGLFAGLFYRMISKVIGFDMSGSSDFKLLGRKAVDALNALQEKETFFRALSFWIGFKSASVSYEVAERAGGHSKWSTRSLTRYAIRNITSFTYAPLRIIGAVGILMLLVGLGLGIDAIISYVHGKAIGGYPSLVILITLSTGGILLSLGIIAVYIAKMYTELKNRPRYIVDDQK